MTDKPVVMLLPYASCSGLELFGLRFAQDLLSRGHRAMVAAPAGSLIAKQCVDRGIELYPFPVTTKYELVSYPAAFRMLRELNPAAVVAFRTQMMYPVQLAKVLTSQHVPFFLFYRIGAGSLYRKDPIHRYLFKNLAAVVPNADYVKDRILKFWGIESGKVLCIKSGVDTKKYQPDAQARISLRHELGLKDDDVIVGSSGRIEQMKGSEDLLRSMFDVGGAGRARENVHLVYIGRETEPGYIDYLRRLAAQFGYSSRFHVLGFRNDVEKVYPAYDLFAFAVNVREAYAYVVLEAMASGVMPIIPDAGGLGEMFSHGVEGFFFEHRNLESLRNTLVEALAVEPARRQAMGEQARQRIVEKASWNVMMQQYLVLFNKCHVQGF
ncbi:MAG: glycosyltransferase family 4 protein [Candidatus Riflebacteria bacterium]|nr:glycosyltransferase family 4 protein [Candidatus Riflebacteria bacterium]